MKKTDINGFWIYENTPLTKEGVFPYLGKQIDGDGSMGLIPNQRYMVYRPKKELTNKATLESFNGLWLTDEHQMLGSGQRPTDTKRCDGTVYNVHVSPYDPGEVLCTLKVMTNTIKDLINQGKRALSCGYYCEYKPMNGVFNGIPYQFVQTDVVGNHVALVKKGRMGEKVGIYDQSIEADLLEEELNRFAKNGRLESQVRGKGKKLTCDSAIDINQNEVKFMPNENYDEMLAKALEGKGVKDAANIDKIIKFISSLPAAPDANGQSPDDTQPAKDAGVTATDPSAAPAPAVAPTATAPAPTDAPAPDATGSAPADPSAAPAPDDTQDGCDGDDQNAPAANPMTVTPEQFQAAVDCGVKEALAKRDAGKALAEQIAPKMGGMDSFYTPGMDEDDVAEVACEKLGGANLPKDAKVPFVKAIANAPAIPGAAPVAPKKGNGQDSAISYHTGHSSVLARYLAGK